MLRRARLRAQSTCETTHGYVHGAQRGAMPPGCFFARSNEGKPRLAYAAFTVQLGATILVQSRKFAISSVGFRMTQEASPVLSLQHWFPLPLW